MILLNLKTIFRKSVEKNNILGSCISISKMEIFSCLTHMKNLSGDADQFNTTKSSAKDFAGTLCSTVTEPLLILAKDFTILTANEGFCQLLHLENQDITNASVFELHGGLWDKPELHKLLEEELVQKECVQDRNFSFEFKKERLVLSLNASRIKLESEERDLFLLTFRNSLEHIQNNFSIEDYKRSINDIFVHTPAIICILRGPEFVYELANENYFQFLGNREIIGKSVKEAFPEAESQGFLEKLKKVYKTGEPFIGNEIPIKLDIGEKRQKLSYLDFVYQPTRNSKGMVDGIFVHAVDVTEQVAARKKVEESEIKLRNLIDTVPAIIWVTKKDGSCSYLNKNWYSYTGQEAKEAEGFGWLNGVHPEEREIAGKAFIEANRLQKPYYMTYRLKTYDGKYRWVMDNGTPKYTVDREFDGMMGTVVDIHEEKINSELVREKEHRLRTVVEEATVAMAVYTGPEMNVELANDAMILLWGKDRSVVGKTLREALPELDGQPFHHLLNKVFTTGEMYWGNEERADLMFNNELETHYFNYTYKPLRNKNGEIYGILNMVQEVTEIVESKALLKESEAYFRQMADLMPTKVTNTDAQGNFIYFNQGWLDYTGLSLDELKIQGWIRFIHPDHRQQFEKLWKHSLQTGEALEMEIKCLNKNGEYKWHINRAEAVRDDSGKIKMWIGATIDIQEQKEVVENLEYSKALLEAHNQANLDGVLLVDTRGEIISFNHRFVEIWNMPQRIIDSKDDDSALEFAEKQLISPEQFLDKVKYLYKTTSSTQVHTDVLRFKDGKIVERYGYTVVGEDGTFYAWSWTFRDITEMERSKSLLKESESHFRQLSNVIPNKVAHTDSEGNYVYFNQSWLDYTGVGMDELRNDGWLKFIHPDEREESIRKWKRSLLTEGKFEMEARFLNKSGKYMWHIIRAEAIKDESGNLKMWVGTTTEIHKIKEEEKRKEDFLKMVSHELKTPVTSIKGYVQLLLSILNSKQDAAFESIPLKPSLERIDHQILRLTRLISEILDLTRIEEDKLQLQKSVFSLNDLIDQTVQDIRYTNTQHIIKVDHHFYCNIYADKDRIGQVLINFVTNAIKYSPDNHEIKVYIEESENDAVQVTVKDQGIGIDKTFHKNIFKRFYRIGGKSEDTYSGFGIGLFLSNEIIQRHNGFIKVKSKLGKGSDFSFILSVAAEDQDN